MSIDSTFLASNYLQNRLNGLSNAEAVSDVNSTINNSSNESVDREFSIAASDNQYLLLKDTVDQHTKHTTLVQISSAALEGVGDYLVQIKEKVSQLESSLLNDPLRVEISSELATLENELSTYLGTSIQSASEKNINISNFSSESETKFFNEVVVNGKFSNAEAQKLAEIEVNFAHGIAEP